MRYVSCRNIERIGRVGNQLFLYAFARGYAEAMGAELLMPQWWGRKVFAGVADDPMLRPMMRLPQTELDSISSKPLGYFFGQTGVDLFVYGQHQRYVDFYTQAKVREWFRLRPEYEAYATGGIYSACHIRRWEHPKFDLSARHNYCTITEASYERAVERFQVPRPIIGVCEGWRAPTLALAEAGLSWLPDWLLLRDATHLLRANSSFSWWAGALSLGKVYSPVVGDKTGLQDVEFVEGNHPCTAGKFANQSNLFLREA